jgi:DNA-3-methyladenine glycosylase I
MMAMTDDCCLHFCGVGHGLDDFLRMMILLVERDDSQYSYRNTLVAMHQEQVVGIAVSYDGAHLHTLRRAFIQVARTYIGKDHSDIDDETQAGELYLDSLAVVPHYRRQGIAKELLARVVTDAKAYGCSCVQITASEMGVYLYEDFGFVRNKNFLQLRL